MRTASTFLAVLTLLFYGLVAARDGSRTLLGSGSAERQQNGTATNAVHVLDMVWMLPAFLITATKLWQKRPFGFVLAGASITPSGTSTATLNATAQSLQSSTSIQLSVQ